MTRLVSLLRCLAVVTLTAGFALSLLTPAQAQEPEQEPTPTESVVQPVEGPTTETTVAEPGAAPTDEPIDARGFLLADLSRAGWAIVTGDPVVVHSAWPLITAYSTFVEEGEERPAECADAPPNAFIQIDHYGYADVTVYELNAALDLSVATGSAAFRVVDGDGAPIQGVCFDAYLNDGEVGAGYCSDTEGNVTIPDLAVGQYTLELVESPANCAPPSELPGIIVTEADLGTTITLSDVVFACEGPPVDCRPDTVVHIRELTVYYGTVTVEGGGESRDGLELTDHITDDLGAQLRAFYPDERVGEGIEPWVVDDQNDMEWLLAAPEDLDAERALRDAYEGFRQGHDGATLAFDDPIDHGTEHYVLTGWTTFEEIEDCNESVEIDHEGFAAVTFVELNATIEKRNDTLPQDDTPERPTDGSAGSATKLPNTGVGPTAGPSGGLVALGGVIVILLLAGVAARPARADTHGCTARAGRSLLRPYR